MELVATHPSRMSMTGCGIVLKDVISLEDNNESNSPDSIVITSDSSKDESVCSNEETRLQDEVTSEKVTKANSVEKQTADVPTACVDISQDSSDDEVIVAKGPTDTVTIASDTDSVKDDGDEVVETEVQFADHSYNLPVQTDVPLDNPIETGSPIPAATNNCDDEVITTEKSKPLNIKVILPTAKSTDPPSSLVTVVSPIVKECIECNKELSCTYSIDISGTICFLCSEKCLVENKFSIKNYFQKNSQTSVRVLSKEEPQTCAQCKKTITPNENTFSWETMDFCQEECLKLYQNSLGVECYHCKKMCIDPSLGKYCVRFGFEIRQFCQASCLEEFKKLLKVCSFCQEDLINGSAHKISKPGKPDKEFCSKTCIDKYNTMNGGLPLQLSVNNCNVCNKYKLVTVEVIKGTDLFHFCSEVCFSAFKFVNPINVGFCDMCKKYFDQKSLTEKYSIFHEGASNLFCSKTCVNLFVLSKRKIVQCNWCKVKKYNFDMIKKIFSNKQVLMFCSFNCFSLWKQSPKRNTCDHCNTFGNITYHLGMSDGTLRSFCGHECLMKFQLQFKKVPVTPSSARPISPVYSTPMPRQVMAVNNPVELAPAHSPREVRDEVPLSVPVISSVTSLDPESLASQDIPSVRKQVPLAQSTPQVLVKHQILIAPPIQIEMCNKVTMCDMDCRLTKNKGVYCTPKTFNKCSQTVTEESVETEDKSSCTDLDLVESDTSKKKELNIVLPIPVYIPVPVAMYSVPVPTPLPIPVPFGVPIFIPTPPKTPDESTTEKENEIENSVEDDLCSQYGKRKQTEDLEDSGGGGDGGSKRRRLDDSSNQESSSNSSGAGTPVDSSGSSGTTSGGFPPPAPNQKPPQKQCTPSKKYLKYMYGVNAWKQWVAKKNESITSGDETRRSKPFSCDILQLTSQDLCQSMCWFITEFKKPSGEGYSADSVYYLCLGIQDYLQANGRVDNIFTDPFYKEFTDCLDSLITDFHKASINELVIPRIEEEHLWESMQLGPYSPYAVLLSLMFFNTKYFLLKTVDAHVKLTFSHIMKHWKRSQSDGNKTTLLRYYPPSVPHTSGDGAKDNHQEEKRLEQPEDSANPLRCPVKLYEFYLSKCSEGVSSRNDVFYLRPERSCIPDSPVWYSSEPLDADVISKMFNRLKLVKEINLALSSN